MTEPAINEARDLVERAEARSWSPAARETHYAVWEADEAAVEALEILGPAESPAALSLKARATGVRASVAAELGEAETARDRYREAARLGEAADTPTGLAVAADAWYSVADAVDGDHRLAALERSLDAGRRAGTADGRRTARSAARELGVARRDAGEAERAVETFEAVVTLACADAEAALLEERLQDQLELGWALEAAGRDAAAAEVWRGASELGWEAEDAAGPAHEAVFARLRYGVACKRSGEDAAAREAFERVLDLDVDDIEGSAVIDQATYDVTPKRGTLALAGLHLAELDRTAGDDGERCRRRVERELEALADEEPLAFTRAFRHRLDAELGDAATEFLGDWPGPPEAGEGR